MVAKSDTHITSLVCLSMTGELYRIDKEFFFSKLSNITKFMKQLEKQCTENVRDQVRKIAFAKQSEEKEMQASGPTIDLSAPTGPRKPDDPIPTGVNVRKERQKIDLKQFDPNDVNHLEPIISVMRPPDCIGRQTDASPANRVQDSKSLATKRSKCRI